MGLSTINVEFKAAAQTAVKRSANGTVALILKDETKEDTTYVYSNETEVVKSHWTSDNLNYINMAFKGSPKKVIIERIAAEGSLDDALKRLANKKWNYLPFRHYRTVKLRLWQIGLLHRERQRNRLRQYCRILYQITSVL